MLAWARREMVEASRALAEYVENGGGLVIVANPVHKTLSSYAMDRLCGATDAASGDTDDDLEVVASHPILGGLSAGQVLHDTRMAFGLAGAAPDATVLLRFRTSGLPALSVREVGRGRVAHFQWPGPLSRGAMLSDADLLVQAIDWVSRRAERRRGSIFLTRPALKRLPERLGLTSKMPIAYEDPFDFLDEQFWEVADADNVGHRWGHRGPSQWSVHPDLAMLVQLSNIGSARPGASYGTNIVGALPLGDYVVSVWATPLDNDQFGVLFRYRDERNCYRLRTYADREQFWALDKIVNGTQETIARVNERCCLPGRTYLVEVAVCGDKIRAYVDGELLVSATDDTHRSGRAGFCCIGQSGMIFDDFVLFRDKQNPASREGKDDPCGE